MFDHLLAAAIVYRSSKCKQCIQIKLKHLYQNLENLLFLKFKVVKLYVPFLFVHKAEVKWWLSVKQKFSKIIYGKKRKKKFAWDSVGKFQSFFSTSVRCFVLNVFEISNRYMLLVLDNIIGSRFIIIWNVSVFFLCFLWTPYVNFKTLTLNLNLLYMCTISVAVIA